MKITHKMPPRRTQTLQKAHKTAQETSKRLARRPRDASKTPQDTPRPRFWDDFGENLGRFLEDFAVEAASSILLSKKATLKITKQTYESQPKKSKAGGDRRRRWQSAGPWPPCQGAMGVFRIQCLFLANAVLLQPHAHPPNLQKIKIPTRFMSLLRASCLQMLASRSFEPPKGGGGG